MSATCPLCGAATVKAFRPFCSKRCADRDLNRWLSGVYVVPGQDGEAADETPVDPHSGASRDNEPE